MSNSSFLLHRENAITELARPLMYISVGIIIIAITIFSMHSVYNVHVFVNVFVHKQSLHVLLYS